MDIILITIIIKVITKTFITMRVTLVWLTLKGPWAAN